MVPKEDLQVLIEASKRTDYSNPREREALKGLADALHSNPSSADPGIIDILGGVAVLCGLIYGAVKIARFLCAIF